MRNLPVRKVQIVRVCPMFLLLANLNFLRLDFKTPLNLSVLPFAIAWYGEQVIPLILNSVSKSFVCLLVKLDPWSCNTVLGTPTRLKVHQGYRNFLWHNRTQRIRLRVYCTMIKIMYLNSFLLHLRGATIVIASLRNSSWIMGVVTRSVLMCVFFNLQLFDIRHTVTLHFLPFKHPGYQKHLRTLCVGFAIPKLPDAGREWANYNTLLL